MRGKLRGKPRSQHLQLTRRVLAQDQRGAKALWYTLLPVGKHTSAEALGHRCKVGTSASFRQLARQPTARVCRVCRVCACNARPLAPPSYLHPYRTCKRYRVHVPRTNAPDVCGGWASGVLCSRPHRQPRVTAQRLTRVTTQLLFYNHSHNYCTTMARMASRNPVTNPGHVSHGPAVVWPALRHMCHAVLVRAILCNKRTLRCNVMKRTA